MNQDNKEEVQSAREAATVFTKPASQFTAHRKESLFILAIGIILGIVMASLVSWPSSGEQKDTAVLEADYSNDVVRLKNAANIMLALQDYNFVNYDFPETLEGLKPVYLSDEANLTDPETKAPYYYSRISDINFIMCIYPAKGGVVGVNIKDCPAQ